MPTERSYDELASRATSAAQTLFGADWTPERWAIAPGRIELIGNHIDYSGGPVLAGAIDRVIAAAVGIGQSEYTITVVAPDVGQAADTFAPQELGDWRATADDHGPGVYVRGIIAALSVRGIPYQNGVALTMAGDIPPGFGMSSSAAFCLAAILTLTDRDLPAGDMVAIAREAEHRAGSPVGAMDQSASVAGGVILFDGRDASFTAMTPELGPYVFAVADSGVDRSLRTSAYGTRVEEAGEACAILSEALGHEIDALATVDMPEWSANEPELERRLGPTLSRRVRHVVTETQRVREAHEALEAADWPRFGQLMNASGESSATDYEISHPRVEELVGELRTLDGVLGARMMGGGEGGPALALLHRDAVEAVTNVLDRGYYRRYALKDPGPHLQVCVFGPGAHRL
jgi:galactokinase